MAKTLRKLKKLELNNKTKNKYNKQKTLRNFNIFESFFVLTILLKKTTKLGSLSIRKSIRVSFRYYLSFNFTNNKKGKI